ncbi:MAG: glycosyltransferase [Clostridiaceae bacterium]|nr:glycosyltransferase [Clostridiaceae bacterium]
MNTLFLGMSSRNTEQYRSTNTGADEFQWRLLNGLSVAASPENLTSFRFAPMASFPKANAPLCVPTQSIDNNLINTDITFGYINLPIIKQLQRIGVFRKNIRNWLETHEGEKNIMVYSPYLPYLCALKPLRRKYNFKLIVIVPDAPGKFGILNGNALKRAIVTMWGDLAIAQCRIADGFILITDMMKEPIRVGKRPYIVVEGAVDLLVAHIPQNTITVNAQAKKVILYTGFLKEMFGVLDLVEAFEQINRDDYELWFAGGGPAAEAIEQKARVNPHIKYFGILPHDDVVNLQLQATVMVNPRRNNGIYTKYSFPSKTFDYLASGKPVVMYRLDGIPKDYDEHLFYVNGNNIADLKARIVEVCEMEPALREKIGKGNAEWVTRTKSYIVQGERIYEFLCREDKYTQYNSNR